MKHFTAFVFLVLILVSSAVAQEFDKQRLDTYFDTLAANNQFMGSVALAKEGKIIYTRSVGFASIAAEQKANEDSKYRIGSITKTFTATLIMKAVEEGKLSLDDTLDNFYPMIKNADKITIRQLLSHRSGIRNITDNPDYLTWHTQPKTESELVEIIRNSGSDFDPDSKASYSNSAFILLTFILEKTFKKPYAKLLEEYITKPLNLHNTHMGGRINAANNECESYRFNGSWEPSPQTDMSIPLGAGAIVSTPSDLVRFADALFKNKIVSEGSVAEMKTIRDNFGLGLFRFPFQHRAGYGHTGGIDAFNSMFGHFPDGDVAFAITFNGTAMSINDVAIVLLSAAYNEPYNIPSFAEYDAVADELDNYVGTYASTQLPLKITVTRNGNALSAQATGQSAFPLEATGPGKFRFVPAGIVMEFDTTGKSLILKQGGGQFQFTKESP